MAEDLIRLLSEDRKFLPCVLDALSNMQLSQEVLTTQLESVYELVDTADAKDLPVAVRFLLQASTGENVARSIQELRDRLDVSVFAVDDDDQDNYSMRLLTSQSKRRKAKEDSIHQNLIYVLESIRTGIRYNKDVEKGFIHAISKAEEFKILDFWVLIIIYSMENYRRDADLLLKKKIKEQKLEEKMLEGSVTKFAEALTQHFTPMNLLAGTWMRHAEEKIRDLGKSFYTLMFCSFSSDYIRQEILQSLIVHIGSRVVSSTQTYF